MKDITIIKCLEDLKKYLNKDGILEIAQRGKNKRFKAFQKIAIDNSSSDEVKESLKKVFDLVSKNNDITRQQLNKLTKLGTLNVALSALNLCATCVGFAIMYAKLDKMSGQINKVMGTVKQGHDITANYEFHKVLSEHSNMLDSRKTQKYYSEEQMRQLVDDEYNVLKMLIEGFIKDHTDDKESLITSIYSMASMMTVSLRYFDELYYLNNSKTIGDGDVWHSSHDNWTSIYDILVSDEFVEKLQDHGVFDLGLTTFETDVYYISLCNQVMDMKETIADNQTLITEFQSAEMMSAFESYLNNEVTESIQQALSQTEGALDNPDVVEAYETAMKQMAMAA